MAVSPIVPNLGRCQKLGPVGLWKYTVVHGAVPVYLYVVGTSGVKATSPARKGDYMIGWDVGWTSTGHVAHRRLELTNECPDHLTNWGPITVADEPKLRPRVSFKIASLSHEERVELENIASRTQVRYSSTGWTSQHWCNEILDVAFQQGLLTNTERNAAVAFAAAE
ncbi:hypothetical protein ONZ45_g14698 [Pleurotus djamor]|nr:hypothetical protein ONZ45_g14698 [Pleurotus djamor]